MRLLVAASAISLLVLSPVVVHGIEVAVTVDDLPSHGPLPAGRTRPGIVESFISVFQKHGIHDAYGFVNAGQLEAAPDFVGLLQRWVDAGYGLGNHTLQHLDLDRVGSAEYLADIARNEEALAPFARLGAPHFFRYPYLHEGDSLAKRGVIRRALHAGGYVIAPVTIDFYDWAWAAPYVRCLAKGDAAGTAWSRASFTMAALQALQWAEEVATTLVKRPVRHVLLVHLGALQADALDDVLNAYAAEGVRFIPLAQALADPIYGIDPRVTWTDQRNFLAQLLRATGRHDTSPRLRPPAKLTTLCG